MRRCLSVVLLAAAALVGATVAASPAHSAETGVVLGARSGGNSADPFSRTADLDVKWVRVYGDWSVLEPAPDQYDQGYLDQFVGTIARLKQDGRKVIVPVFLTPQWASGDADRTVPPRDPNDYASFLRELIGFTGGRVDAWEIWNEPDLPQFWRGAPNPAAYAPLLAAAYQAVKAADRDALVVTGGLTGNNHDFLQALYDRGLKGSFDAVGVHTDTACLTSPPEEYYREPDGNIGRFSFTGYRELREVTVRNGDPKPIWMTELGWETDTRTCRTGDRAGTKAQGVTETQQASYLERAYRCVEQDDYLQVAIWFSLQDVDDNNRHGLIRDSGVKKPSYDRMKEVAHDGVKPPKEYCGGRLDHVAPVVRLSAPTRGTQYFDRLLVRATASDDQRITRMELYADGQRVPGSQEGGRFRLDWQGSRKLGFGAHTITVRAYDEAHNAGEASTTVMRVNPDQLPPVKPIVDLRIGRPRPGFRIRVRGGLRFNSPVRPLGRVLVLFERRQPHGGYRVVHKFSKGTRKRFDFVPTLKGPGRWRVKARFEPTVKPFVPATSRTRSFRMG